jgi:hypothetical protein
MSGSNLLGDVLERTERQYAKPVLTLFSVLAFMLGALQIWIASKFATKTELQNQIQLMRDDLKEAHQEHMDDYRKIESSVDSINRLLLDRLPRPGERL